MQRLHKVAALIAAFIFMALVPTVQAGLIEDIEMVKSDFGIRMTDEVTTFEKRGQWSEQPCHPQGNGGQRRRSPAPGL